jgi:Chaperone of endosialidase
MKRLLLTLPIIVLTFPVFAQTTLYTNGASGDVGIGTTAPDVLLSLDGQSARTIDVIRETTASTAGNNLTVQAGGAVSGGTNLGGGSLIISSGISTGNNTSNVQIQTYPPGSSGTADNSALTVLTISATGATGSNAVTTVQGNAGSGTNKNGGTLTLASGVSTGTGTSGINFNVYGAGSSGSSANSSTTAMTIASSANVGVGITTPALTMEIHGPLGGPATSGTSQTGILRLSQTGGSNVLDIGYGNGNLGPWLQSTNSSNLAIATNMSINPNGGSVGIGTNNPLCTLHVNGSVAGTSAYVNLSDSRHKKNIKPLAIGLKEIQLLKPVTFDWVELSPPKPDKPRVPFGMEGQQIGFIAEDVEKVIPSAVVTEDNDEKTRWMKYSEIIPVLTKAMQEQEKAIQQQQAEINTLEQTVKRLEHQK